MKFWSCNFGESNFILLHWFIKLGSELLMYVIVWLHIIKVCYMKMAKINNLQTIKSDNSIIITLAKIIAFAKH